MSSLRSVRPQEECESVAMGPADLAEFAKWLSLVGEVDALDYRHLWALYGEFAMFTEMPQMSKGRFFRAVKIAGICRYREGSGQRRWLYRVERR